jgi:hypothetical protein
LHPARQPLILVVSAQGKHMNSKDILTVLLRLMTLLIGTYLFGLAALYMPNIFASNNSDRSSMLAFAGVALLALILLMVFARQLASLLLPKTSWNNVVSAASLVQELTRAALCVIAVYYIVSSLAGLPVLLIYFGNGMDAFTFAGQESLSQLIVISPLIDLAVGILLLFSANRLSTLICNRPIKEEQSTNAL